MYTIQTRDAYETLVRDGALVGDSSLGWPAFQEAYAWMLRQMAPAGAVRRPALALALRDAQTSAR